jgi:hypothetical protein
LTKTRDFLGIYVIVMRKRGRERIAEKFPLESRSMEGI